MIQLKIGLVNTINCTIYYIYTVVFSFRHEFLNQYLGGSTIFMKAKRSLTSSFDQLMKRRSSKDDLGIMTTTKENYFPNSVTFSKVNSLVIIN